MFKKIAWIGSHHHLFPKVCWQRSAMFCFYTSCKLSRPWFGFSLKVMGSNPGYLLKSFQLYPWLWSIIFCLTVIDMSTNNSIPDLHSSVPGDPFSGKMKIQLTWKMAVIVPLRTTVNKVIPKNWYCHSSVLSFVITSEKMKSTITEIIAVKSLGSDRNLWPKTRTL